MHKLWTMYLNDPDPAVGIFTMAGAILSVLAVIFSASAAKTAQKSTVIAKEALDKATENAQRD